MKRRIRNFRDSETGVYATYVEQLPDDPDPEAVDEFIAAFERYMQHWRTHGEWESVTATWGRLKRGAK